MKRVRSGASEIHGRGLFADEDIGKGDKIQFIRGRIARKTPRTPKESQAIANWIGVRKGIWIVPKPPFLYLNHSCEPNAAIVGTRLMIALRRIRKGEEITMDYSLTDCDPHWHLRCGCGAKRCRKHIRPIQELPPAVYKKYLPHVTRYFRSAYERAHPHVR